MYTSHRENVSRISSPVYYMLDTYNASKNNIGREMLSRISSKEDEMSECYL